MWSALIPVLSTVLSEVVKSFSKTTAPSIPQQPTSPPPANAPSETVRGIQHMLNQYVKPVPPLKEDGWLGPKTEAALKQGLATFGITL